MASASRAEPARRSTEAAAAAPGEGPDTPEQRVDAVTELARRTLPGTAFHLAGLIFVELRLPGADQLPRSLVITLFLGFVAVRILGHYAALGRRGPVGLRLPLLAIGSIGANVVWGVRTATVQLHTGASEQSILMLIIMCGLTTGALTSFAPSLWLQRATQSAMFVPILIAGVAGHGLGSLAVLHALFFVYILGRGSVAHREYWAMVHSNALLRRHARSAQLAAAAADEANLQLRTEIAHSARMEIELRQAQKLEAIGRLAAGIAHEINTPLQFIADSCRFLAEGAGELIAAAGDYRRLVDDIGDGRLAAAEATAEAGRIAEVRDLAYLRDNLPGAAALALGGLARVGKIVAATKDYTGPHLQDRVPTDINQAIESTILLSSNETRYVADVETELGDLPAVSCHPGELNQAVLNIIVNAAHAIGDAVEGTGGRGVIRIRTWADPGWVRISISDTGTGIPAEILDKIYDPFFTTKPVGRGTGQGLTSARLAVVNKHGGTLDVSSRPGVGTTFTIGLPVV